MIQVLPLDLNMEKDEAEKRAKSEIGSVVNNIAVTEQNYTQRIKQYMNHGLSNAVGMGEDFLLNEKYFDAKVDTAMFIASDGVTDPFMEPQSQAGNILQEDAEKLYELFNTSANAKESVVALENMIWDTRVDQKKKIKPDDRTALFLYFSSNESADVKKLNVNSMTNEKLVAEMLKILEQQRTNSLDVDVTMSLSDLDSINDIANELSRKINK